MKGRYYQLPIARESIHFLVSGMFWTAVRLHYCRWVLGWDYGHATN